MVSLLVKVAAQLPAILIAALVIGGTYISLAQLGKAQKTIATLTANAEQQTASYEAQVDGLRKHIENTERALAEREKALAVFNRSADQLSFDQLVQVKPALVERLANKATAKVFSAIECEMNSDCEE